MKYNINHKHRIIFFWAPKSGVISLIQLMVYLQLKHQFSARQLGDMSDEVLYRLFHTKVRQRSLPGVDYTPFKKVFFGRNPYHRIVSCYIDKYVEPDTVTPKEVPDCETYAEFLNILQEMELKKENMEGHVDFGHFCSVKDDFGWDFLPN